MIYVIHNYLHVQQMVLNVLLKINVHFIHKMHVIMLQELMVFVFQIIQHNNVELNNVQIYKMEQHMKYVILNYHFVYLMENNVFQKIIVLIIQQKQHVIMVD